MTNPTLHFARQEILGDLVAQCMNVELSVVDVHRNRPRGQGDGVGEHDLREIAVQVRSEANDPGTDFSWVDDEVQNMEIREEDLA